jgi:hypothetical protein
MFIALIIHFFQNKLLFTTKQDVCHLDLFYATTYGKPSVVKKATKSRHSAVQDYQPSPRLFGATAWHGAGQAINSG